MRVGIRVNKATAYLESRLDTLVASEIGRDGSTAYTVRPIIRCRCMEVEYELQNVQDDRYTGYKEDSLVQRCK